MPKTKEIIDKIVSSQTLLLEESFDMARTCSIFLKNEKDSHNGRKIIINVLDNWHKVDKLAIEIWTDLIEAAGFYPYLEKNKKELQFNNLVAEIRKERHFSQNLSNKYFHEEQNELLELLKKDKNVIVSAPTSFGKSLLIEEIIASKRYCNIVVIQPTLALLDETRRKLNKYKNSYKLIVRTSQEPSNDKRNIFLFTAERVNEYETFPKIDFLVIDEFYKLSGNRDDERSSSLNNAFHYLLKNYSPKFYLLGPNIDGISPGFEDNYNAVFFKSYYSLVDSKEINFVGEAKETKESKETRLFKLLLSLDTEQTIIYCSSPNRVRQLAKKFTNYLIEKGIESDNQDLPLIEWIKVNVTEEWSVLKNLKHRIGIHDGALQKHITASIIDYFNGGKLNYLFCTSTIIEGVNTSAKNMIYFDPKKGPKHIDYFDYANIKGRAGRMMEHYVGKIYNFNQPPKNEKIIIDIPFFQQNPIKDEVLIQLDANEVINKNTEQYKSITTIPNREREVIKKNGVKVHGQGSVFKVLREDIAAKHDLICWDFTPTYQQLMYIIKLAWDNLLVEGETTRPMTQKKLTKVTFDYGLQKDIDYLIKSSFSYLRKEQRNEKKEDAELLDKAIQESFQIMRHWFQYKVPKWLSVINEIQKFVCAERGLRPGNYTHYANLIENDFLRENVAILAEYGIPSSAVRKLEKLIPAEVNQDDVLGFIKDKKIFDNEVFLNYEKEKIVENMS